MKFKFTHHAQYRIRERNISIEHVKDVINRPDYSGSVLNGNIQSRKKFGKKTLEVVYFKDKNEFVIITAYYL